jgi:hypothetical protein
MTLKPPEHVPMPVPLGRSLTQNSLHSNGAAVIDGKVGVILVTGRHPNSDIAGKAHYRRRSLRPQD